MKKTIKINLLGVFVCLAFFSCMLLPKSASATEHLEISGWVPYWVGSSGPKDAQAHMDVLTEIHPFGYSVKSTGALEDLMKIKSSAWRKMIADARANNVLVSPTVMWSDGKLMHSILSNPKKRTAHIEEIVEMVEGGEFDGVNIDYEAKLAETKDYFSVFLKELKATIGSKRLSCAIEARTPPDSLYRIIPTNIQYANDYVAIAQHCDRVQIMGYDQRRADIKLNSARLGTPYMPVADVDWVRKVVVFALQSIPKEKLVLGVPSYGHEYEVTVSPQWYQSYERLRALNPDTAKALLRKNKARATRNSAGELAFTFTTKSTASKVKTYKAPEGTLKGNTVAAQALAYANKTGKTTKFNLVSWSDATAVESKVRLAEEFGLRGVALFKIDGIEDQDIWDIFEE